MVGQVVRWVLVARPISHKSLLQQSLFSCDILTFAGEPHAQLPLDHATQRKPSLAIGRLPVTFFGDRPWQGANPVPFASRSLSIFLALKFCQPPFSPFLFLGCINRWRFPFAAQTVAVRVRCRVDGAGTSQTWRTPCAGPGRARNRPAVSAETSRNVRPKNYSVVCLSVQVESLPVQKLRWLLRVPLPGGMTNAFLTGPLAVRRMAHMTATIPPRHSRHKPPVEGSECLRIGGPEKIRAAAWNGP